ncbi:hypothetical protein A3B42_04115 [Candidatus Daviesbacteria bacterium RIFCSPLOWO2_01_FULL_38_10]|nr:MAG: hypothetical protein A3D02_04265 [Candidatus Daviesbacteria bacterium RIFCSPHIGHO2_02_FULL_39_41]OGE37213.1 MAG: hypothetical protein A3B42_04115 [Candidatus Daviesbacteria bacterium RIFCSPLOWO2_01_FULL_38_10]OGE44963.1 MAG: hypothetical protein A3E67_02240 [Candidatus Daviesbacteria bacterium RIFCSPHIGHO2_12_FULL_38_25]
MAKTPAKTGIYQGKLGSVSKAMISPETMPADSRKGGMRRSLVNIKSEITVEDKAKVKVKSFDAEGLYQKADRKIRKRKIAI